MQKRVAAQATRLQRRRYDETQTYTLTIRKIRRLT